MSWLAFGQSRLIVSFPTFGLAQAIPIDCKNQLLFSTTLRNPFVSQIFDLISVVDSNFAVREAFVSYPFHKSTSSSLMHDSRWCL